MVNLDGAFDQAGASNWQVLPRLTQLGAKVQFGGGVRSLADIERALNAGVSRVVLGTVAVEEPELVAAAIQHFSPAAIAIGIDARDGLVKTRGWQTDTPLTALELAQRMAGLGVETIIHTDIGRDGVLVGVNAAATAHLAQATGLQFIASGGVASLADVQATVQAQLHGLIIGRALYEGKVDLREALDWIGTQRNSGELSELTAYISFHFILKINSFNHLKSSNNDQEPHFCTVYSTGISIYYLYTRACQDEFSSGDKKCI